MICDKVRDQLVLLSYGELDEDAQAELELHLHSCMECTAEAEEFQLFQAVLQQGELPNLPANLLAASRLKLDEALDGASTSTWTMRLRMGLLGVWQHLYAAPALATLLVGVGFTGGTLLERYQAAHQRGAVPSVLTTNQPGATVGAISAIEATPMPNVVQVHYTQIVPTTFQGNVDEPQVRQLLMLAAERSADNTVRAQSVDYLVRECRAGRSCEHGKGDATDVRDALLVSLRYDKSPAVRLKALEGLQPYVSVDQKVRDAVLESLQRDGSAEVRRHAIGLLEPVEGDSSVRQVLHSVSTQDANPYIRTVSMQALGNVDAIQ